MKKLQSFASQLRGILTSRLAILILAIFRLFRPYRFMILMDNRIGHFLAEVGYYLRRRELDPNYATPYDVLLCGTNPANQTIIEITRKHMTVVCSDLMKRIVNQAYQACPNHPAIYQMPHIVYAPEIFDKTQSPFHLTSKHEERGRNLLAQMGIPEGDPVICFAVRDPAFLQYGHGPNSQENFNYHNYRNPDIDAYIAMAENLADRGYWVIRMGSVVEKPISTHHPRIIDYATQYRSDFGDVFFGSYCKLLICDSSGIVFLYQALGSCGIRANLNVADMFTPWLNFMTIPVRYRDIKTGSIISYGEAIKRGVLLFARSDQFEKAGLEIVYNTSIELTEAALEFLEKINNGDCSETNRSSLEQTFFSLYPKDHAHSHIQSRSTVASTFLNRHSHLLK